MTTTEMPFYNLTTTAHDDDGDHEEDPQWFQVLRAITLTVFIAFGAYIVWALARYEHKVRYLSRKRGRTRSGSAFGSMSMGSSRRNGLMKRWLTAVDAPTLAAKMRICSIASPTCATLLFVAQLVYELLHIFAKDVHVCELMTNLIFTLLTWSTVFIYLLLWLRQRSIYTNSAVKELTTPAMEALSYTTLVLIVLDAFLVPVFFGIGRHFLLQGDRCHLRSDSRLHFYYIIVTLFLSIVFHVSLLYLFARPLARHQGARKQDGKTSVPSAKKTGRRLEDVTSRACYVTLYGVIVDVSIMISTAVLSYRNEKLQAILEDAILLSGIVTSMLTFVNWRERLFPLRAKKQNSKIVVV